MVRHIDYTIDESGDVIARIPGMQGYYSFGENHEDARDNLLDTIESLILAKIASGDISIIKEIKKYQTHNHYSYA